MARHLRNIHGFHRKRGRPRIDMTPYDVELVSANEHQYEHSVSEDPTVRKPTKTNSVQNMESQDASEFNHTSVNVGELSETEETFNDTESVDIDNISEKDRQGPLKDGLQQEPVTDKKLKEGRHKYSAENSNKLQLNRMTKALTFRCLRCSFVADRKRVLINHLRRIHKVNPRSKYLNADDLLSDIELVDESETETKDGSAEECSGCTEPELADKTVSDLIEEHAISSVESLYKCKLCGRQFSRRRSISTHIRSHNREKRVQVCGSGKKKYRCKKCGYTSVHGHHALRHWKQMHAGRAETQSVNKAVSEQTTNKGHDETTTDALDQLELVEHGKTPTFHCPKCNFVTAYSNALRRHVRKLHERHGRPPADLTSSDVELVDVNLDQTDDKPEEVCTDTTNTLSIAVADSEAIISLQRTGDTQQQTNAHENHNFSGNISNDLHVELSPRISKVSPTSDLVQEYANYNSTKRAYGCKICGRMFSKLHGLTKHTNAHIRGNDARLNVGGHGDGRKAYRCKKCGFTAPDGFRILRHMRQMHGHGINSVMEQEGTSEHISDIQPGRTTKVVDENSNTEQKTAPSPERIDNSQTDDVSSSNRGNDVAKSSSLQTGDSWSGVPSFENAMFELMHDAAHVCRLCSKKLWNSSALQRHIREVHLRMKQRSRITKSNLHMYKKCPHCRRFFKTDVGLARHMKWHESAPDLMLPCNECGHLFSSAGALKTHLANHNKVRSHVCKVCGKAFYSSQQMLTHELVHTGEKPYCCDTCGDRFSTRGALGTHQRRHTGDKPFRCHNCGKTFTTSTQQKDHIIVMHTDWKPFSCPVCHLKFGLRKAARRHVKVRHGAAYLTALPVVRSCEKVAVTE